MNAEAQAALTRLGISLAKVAIERYSRQRAEEMTDAEILRAVRALEVRSADELLATGAELAGKSGEGGHEE